MLKSIVVFYWKLWQQLTWQPAWLLSEIPSKRHFHRRRLTEVYRKKQRLVRSLWFSALMIMLALPALPLVVAISLFTTFVSFSILDETPD